jgi:hypothetical protein
MKSVTYKGLCSVSLARPLEGWLSAQDGEAACEKIRES